MTFVHLVFSVWSLDLFCHFTRASDGHFMLYNKEEFLVELNRFRSCYDKFVYVIGLHDFRCYLHVAL